MSSGPQGQQGGTPLSLQPRVFWVSCLHPVTACTQADQQYGLTVNTRSATEATP